MNAKNKISEAPLVSIVDDDVSVRGQLRGSSVAPACGPRPSHRLKNSSSRRLVERQPAWCST
jgi:hypothetical protein